MEATKMGNKQDLWIILRTIFLENRCVYKLHDFQSNV